MIEKEKEKVLFYKVMKERYMMNKLILIFLLLGVLGFSKDIRDKKISQEKRKFLLKLSERIPYRTETETLVDYSCICIFNRK